MIKLIKPYISFDEVEAEFRKTFESGWFTKGPNVDNFKKALCEYTGAKYSHLTTSATTALTSCLKILNIKPGDEVVISDFSFPATANVVEDLGAVPIFADVDWETFNMLPEALEKSITDKTKAVIFVDALGNPSGLHKIKDICASKNLPLIEDAACAIGSSENGKKVGSIADLTCFSFHPRKLLSTGEGGAILTNNEEWNEILKIKLEHGAKIQDGKFDFVDFGYNYRLPELQSIMGLSQIRKLDSIVSSRIKIREEFCTQLEPLGYKPQRLLSDVVYNVQSLVFLVPDGVNRDALISFLKEQGIESTIGTYCLSGCTYYREHYNNVQPNAEKLQRSTITFPCHDDVDASAVCDVISQFQS
ncbi:MAG: DegT/DnrJ/EryC1/StrS family aminotransferase [Spirochaetales bacterium]|nr:DegT/DnrJ/EryC1/StrS family aminotransferase [Spirochaetales bacterium]